MNEATTKANLATIKAAIEAHDAKHGYVPTHVLSMDGRTLRALEQAGFIRMSPQNNGATERRYLSTWSDVTLTTRALTLLDN